MDRLVTLFGGGGFLGRYVAQAIYKTGARVRIAQPHPERAFFLKPLGALGQTQFMRTDIRDPRQVAAAVDGATSVVNLVGTFSDNLYAIHVDGAQNVARAATQAGVQALVQVSAIGADPQAASHYARTKGLGEDAVKEAFPNATIVRPSIIFGQEDNFTNRFARMARLMPAVPVLRGDFRLQPVFVGDVAHAICAAAGDPGTYGAKTYEFGGPQILSMREFNAWIAEATGHNRMLIDVPDSVGAVLARLSNIVPGAPITWDQWLMLQDDNVVGAVKAGLDAFGITPTPLAAAAEGWLTAYRRHGRFATKSPY